MTDLSLRRDPFGAAADASAYIPRPATEEALAQLTSYLRVGASQVALRGPGGMGKTLLLRVMAVRLANALRVVEVPYPSLPPDEIAGWILSLMGVAASQDPERTLVQRARQLREEGSGLAILLDDAGATPLPTLRRLSRIAREARPALHLVLVVPDDARGDEVVAAVGPDVEVVRFDTPMDEQETRAYLDGRLLRAGATGRVRQIFAEQAATPIHQESGGVTGEVNRVARRFWFELAGTASAPAAELGSRSAPRRGSSGLGSALLSDSAPIELETPTEILPGRSLAEAPTEILSPSFGGDREEPPAEPAPAAETQEPASDATLRLVVEPEPASPLPPPDPDPAPESRSSRTGPPLPVRRRHPPRTRSASLALLLLGGLALAFVLGRWSSEWPQAAVPEVASLWNRLRDRLGIDQLPTGPSDVSAPEAAPVDHGPGAEVASGTEPAASPPAPEPVAAPEPTAASEPVAARAPEETATARTAPAATATATEAASAEAEEVAATPPPPEAAAAPRAETGSPSEAPSPTAAGAEEPGRPEAQESGALDVATAPPVVAEATAPRAGSESGSATSASTSARASGESAPTAQHHAAVPTISVSINAVPWATIAVDGQEIGVTPLADVPVSHGEHEFRATFGDGREVVRRERIDDLNRRILFR